MTDDDGILVSHQVVSLKDPMSGQRIALPARFTDASGLQAFDLDSYLRCDDSPGAKPMHLAGWGTKGRGDACGGD